MSGRSSDVSDLRAAASQSLHALQTRVGVPPRPGRPTVAAWVPRAVRSNRGAVRLSYALVATYRDIKGLVAEPEGFGLEPFGLDGSAFLNRVALDSESTTLVRRMLVGYLRDQATSRDALIDHLAEVQRDRLLGPATPGKLAFIREATGQPPWALSPDQAALHLVTLRRRLIELLDRQADRLRRNGRSPRAVAAMIQRIRVETTPTTLTETGLIDYSDLADTVKRMYLGNARLPRPGDRRYGDDIDHFCHVYADELAAILARHRDGPTGGINVRFAPRDPSFVVLGDRFGDCSARRSKRQVDVDIHNIHWTVYSWLLAPYYRVLLVTHNHRPVIKGHVLPLLLGDCPVLALDAIEVIPPLREEVSGRPNPFRSRRLLDLRSEFLRALFEATRELGRRVGVAGVIVDKYSNCSWVRRAVSTLPDQCYHVQDARLPHGLEPIRFLNRELLGPGHDDHDLALEIQARNTTLFDQGLRDGWKEVGVLDGDTGGGPLLVRGP